MKNSGNEAPHVKINFAFLNITSTVTCASPQITKIYREYFIKDDVLEGFDFYKFNIKFNICSKHKKY